MCLNIRIDFYYEETQTQSTICDHNSEIKNYEENKVDHYETKSEEINEQNIELGEKSDLANCKYLINIFSINK